MELVEDNISEFNVEFHGPKDSELTHLAAVSCVGWGRPQTVEGAAARGGCVACQGPSQGAGQARLSSLAVSPLVAPRTLPAGATYRPL